MDFFSSPLIFLWVLPLIINYFLAKSRGKNVFLMLFLTLFLSWLITISLVCMQLVEKRSSPLLEGNTCPICHRQYRSDDAACFICSLNNQLVEQPVHVQHGKICKNCGRHNRINDVACYSCNTLLSVPVET